MQSSEERWEGGQAGGGGRQEWVLCANAHIPVWSTYDIVRKNTGSVLKTMHTFQHT